MRTLVVGGSGSGKSAYAEKLACARSGRRTYLATMTSAGPEARERIVRHRAQRAGLGFVTYERTASLCPLPPAGGVVLLDDLGNLVANALFAPDGTMADPRETLSRLDEELQMLEGRFEHVVAVGIEVGSAGPYPHDATNAWIWVVGALCCRLAARYDEAIEVVAGTPCCVKGACA